MPTGTDTMSVAATRGAATRLVKRPAELSARAASQTTGTRVGSAYRTVSVSWNNRWNAA